MNNISHLIAGMLHQSGFAEYGEVCQKNIIYTHNFLLLLGVPQGMVNGRIFGYKVLLSCKWPGGPVRRVPL